MFNFAGLYLGWTTVVFFCCLDAQQLAGDVLTPTFCPHQDLPDGNFAALKKSGDKLRSKGHPELFVALKCVRTPVLPLLRC